MLFRSGCVESAVVRECVGLIKDNKPCKKIKGNPKVLTVHGDNQSCTRFAEEIHEKFGLDAHAPAIDETISI